MDYDRILDEIRTQGVQFAQGSFNCKRPLTPIQKESMRKDFDSLRHLKAYIRILLKDLNTAFHFPVQLTPVLELYRDKRLSSTPVHAVARVKEAMSDLPESTQNDIAQILTLQVSHYLHDGFKFTTQLEQPENIIKFEYSLAELKKDEWARETYLVEFDFSRGFPVSILKNNLPDTIALTYLYLCDVNMVVHYSSGRGRTIPRFLPFYPTKEINQILFARFKKEVRICRLMVLEGIDISTLSRADLMNYSDALGIKNESNNPA